MSDARAPEPDDVPFVTDVKERLDEEADTDTVVAEAAEMGDPNVPHYVEGE